MLFVAETVKMSEEAATADAPAREFDAAIKDIGDKIAVLTLIQAKELTDYLKDAYGIEPAAGGAIVAAMPAGGDADAVEEKTEFNLIIKAVGDKKLQVIKVVRAARSDLGLKEAKALVDGAPKAVLEEASKEDAEKWGKQLEEAGATISIE